MSAHKAAPLRTAFLQSFPGIGPRRAEHLLRLFGDELPSIMSDEEQIRERLVPALDVNRGIAAFRIAHAMHRRWPLAEASYRAHAWLEAQGVDEAGLAAHVVGYCGPGAADLLEQNPYVLARALSWPTVDGIGLAVLTKRLGAGGAAYASERLGGACDRAMADVLATGCTASTEADFRSIVARRLRLYLGHPVVTRAIALAVRQRRTVREGALHRSPGCAWMEREIARRLCLWSKQSSIIASATDQLSGRSLALTSQLHAEQVAALRRVLSTRFAVLAGGAGTGKTSTLRAVTDIWEAMGGRVQLATLSGKAALRLSQATGRLAKTIHRFLDELDREEESGESTSLDDRTMLIVDEASMVDLGQWMRLTEKVEERGSQLLMVGDEAQLPPIGPGNVFHVAVQQAQWTARLNTIHRQTGASGIPEVAWAFRHRRTVSLPAYDGSGAGASLLEVGKRDLVTLAQEVAIDLGDFSSSHHDLQIVAARNSTVASLNAAFHARRSSQLTEIKGEFRNWFSVGDPIVHAENDYRAGLFNGVLGHVVAVDNARRSLTAMFDGTEHIFDRRRLLKISLAYALTCHKLQGSQAKRVIVVLERSPLVDPAWLYTAITRAQEQVVIIGDQSALDVAMRREPAWARRVTGFAHEIAAAGVER